MEETYAKMLECVEELKAGHEKFIEKGTKAAAQRARKAAGELKKLITPYKQANMAKCKE